MCLILSLHGNTARRTVPRSERASAIIPVYFSSVLMASEMYADLIAHLRTLFLSEITRHSRLSSKRENSTTASHTVKFAQFRPILSSHIWKRLVRRNWSLKFRLSSISLGNISIYMYILCIHIKKGNWENLKWKK